MIYINTLGVSAKIAARAIANASTIVKNEALMAISRDLIDRTEEIIAQNNIDLEKAVANKMSVSMQDRLMLNASRIASISGAIVSLIKLDDPIGKIISGSIRPNGMKIEKVRVPLGVIGIIYESRPNVTIDAATLCLKAGNAVILRGGKEAYNSNKCLVSLMQSAVKSVGLPPEIIQFVDDTSREVATQMMRCNDYIDVLIPRGGAALIKSCVENATVPVIQTGTGNCHAYVDETADFSMAVEIVNNSKTTRPSVCNSLETLLVNSKIAKEFLPKIKTELDKSNVQIRGCDATIEILGNSVIKATEEDYATEFLDYIISVKVVESLDEAIAHISKYSTKHSEVIITKSLENSEKFRKEVDSAAVYVNVSTRFTDGEEFGFGAEIGISTQKLHARGPMGLDEMTSIKYLISGNGQIR